MDPVIIVGAGPVGLTLALALARQEVPSVVLDEGPGKDEQRLARTAVLREDTAALIGRLTGFPVAETGFRWAGWRSMRRKQVMRQITFGPDDPALLHLPQHVLTAALREAIGAERLVRIAVDSRLDSLEQEPMRRHRAHPRPQGHLVARQLPGRLRRPPLDGTQAPGHPFPGTYGRGTPRRRRTAHGTPVAR